MMRAGAKLAKRSEISSARPLLFASLAPALIMTMLRQACRIAARQVAVRPPTAGLPTLQAQAARAFGAVSTEVKGKEIARPFVGASISEPEMEYVEEPSMLYMTCLIAAPWVFSFWGLTKYV